MTKTKLYRDKRFWNKVKQEYLQGDTPKEICERHDLSMNTLNSRIKNHGWREERREAQYKEKREAKIESVQEAKDRFDKENKALCDDIGHTLLKKIAMSCETVDVDDRAGIRQLASSLKDLKELRLWVDLLDKTEQEARIKKLQKDAEEKDDKNVSITVSFTDDIDKLV